jgi:hypothetical protein
MKPFRKTRQTRKDNIKMDLKDMGQKSVNCIYLAQNRDQCKVLQTWT